MQWYTVCEDRCNGNEAFFVTSSIKKTKRVCIKLQEKNWKTQRSTVRQHFTDQLLDSERETKQQPCVPNTARIRFSWRVSLS